MGPREQVKITLSSGSLIVEVELDVQGQAEVIEEAAVLAQQEAENVDTILEAIKASTTLQETLGIEDLSTLNGVTSFAALEDVIDEIAIEEALGDGEIEIQDDAIVFVPEDGSSVFR